MKKWKRILAVAVMLALVFCACRGSAVLGKKLAEWRLTGSKCSGIYNRELGTWIW